MIWLDIDKSGDISLTKQICGQLRERILKKDLVAGQKLPSTRKLALELGISRNRMLEVYEQLTAEGYLESYVGSGTYIAKNSSPEKYLNNSDQDNVYIDSNWDTNKSSDVINFISGTPDLSMFPRIRWSKCLKEACLDAPPDILDYVGSAGVFDLRVTISKLLQRTKGIKCRPEQIIIISGSSEGFLILAKMLGRPLNKVMIEDPAYVGIKRIFEAMNINLHTVPVDEKGIITDLLPDKCESSLIIVTPSHQFPLGSVLPVQRRIKLIEYSRKNNIFIVENDYDSEFRYAGLPISPLYLIDPDRVIHMGTFSESMYPGIRTGYMIVPASLVDKCCEVKEAMGLLTSSVKQMALSYFIKKGFYEIHISKMRKSYQKKNEILVNSLKGSFKNTVRITGDTTGLFIVCEFEGIEFNNEVLRKIEESGVLVYTVEEHSVIKGVHSNKIILGYGNLGISEIEEGISRLKKGITC